MDELKTWNELSADQQKACKKALNRSQLRLGLSAATFVVGLFLANVVTIMLGAYILGAGADVSIKNGYQFAAVVINAIFLGRYFVRATQKISSDLKEQITAITKQ